MITTAGRILVCVASLGVAAACAQLVPSGTSDVTGRRQQVQELIEQGNYPEALVQLRVLGTLRPGDAEIARLRASVEGELQRLAGSRYEKAEAELRRNSRAAYRDYLAVLAYDPGHEGALRRLRQLELQRNRTSRPAIGGPRPPTELAYPDTPVEAPGPVAATQPPPRHFPKPRPKPEGPAAVPTATAGAPAGGDEVAGAKRRPPGAEIGPVRDDERTTDTARRQMAAVGADSASKKPAEAVAQQPLESAVATAKAGTYLNLIEYAETYLASHPEDDKAMELLALSHEKAGLALYHDGKLRQSLRHLEFAVAYSGDPEGPPATALAEAKARLADETFELGVRAFRDDISQAIAYWEETLTYDPGHARAKKFLTKAYRIRDTLNAISKP